MGCAGCGLKVKGAVPTGCGDKGHCSTGGCSKLEVYDWLSDVAATNFDQHNIHEVSFKGGARKEFFINEKHHDIVTGDFVLVETGSIGYDIGRVSLSGELVNLQMKKKLTGKNKNAETRNIIRRANESEMDKLEEARSREKETMLRARVMARDLGLDMKLGDVEFQADLRKATFYYTAEGRVDFRELIKVLAKEFKVKIEMRQIGARQEAGRVGGIGSCGRELCCSSWLTSFKSVNTTAARYQNLSINQTKLSGQCGRLKCCLNYELDTYLDALRNFPNENKAKKLATVKGNAYLVKTDVLKGVMTYSFPETSDYYSLNIEDVKMVLEMNAKGEKPEDLTDLMIVEEVKETHEYEDLVGQISIETLEKADRKNKKKGRNQKRKKRTSANSTEDNNRPVKAARPPKGQQQSKEGAKPSDGPRPKKKRPNKRRKGPNNRNKPGGEDKPKE
ncbi:MAG: regulatory iron-sulfur-containing complex subunit RicT [Chitinophagales bacterium]